MKHPLVPTKASSALTPVAFARRVKIPAAPSAERSRDTAANASALATRRAYSSDWRIFETWCIAHGREPVPCSEQTLCEFNLARMEGGCSIRTVQRGMVSVRARQALGGYPDPFGVYARAHWRGLRKQWYRHPDKAAPLITADVHQLADAAGRQTLRAMRSRALILIGFAAALRRGEMVAMRVEDVRFVDTPEFVGIDLTIPRSKTDQDGSKGQHLGIEATGTPWCPVAALKLWLLMSGIKQGPVFQSIRGKRRLTGQAIASWQVAALIQKLVLVAGIPERDGQRYSGHSLRSGCCTQLYYNKVPEADIMNHMRHTNVKQSRAYDQATIASRSRTKDLGL